MKPVLTFVLGAVLASGVVYYLVESRDNAPVESASTPTQSSTPVRVVDNPAVAPAPGETQKPSAMPARREPAKPAKNAKNAKQEAAPPQPAATTPPPQTAPTQTARNQDPATSPFTPQPAYRDAEPAKPAPRQPRSVTIPAGTIVTVRLDEELDSNKNSNGDQFRATLDQPLVVNGLVLAERGAQARGRVTDVDRGGRVSGKATMSVVLTQVTSSDGQNINFSTENFTRIADSGVKGDAAKIGGAAAVGALIGAVAGGGKGAAIGAGVGGAAGTGGVMATRGKAAQLPLETKISFKTAAPVSVTERLRN
ncbi:MAG TPA: hypothetical protein VE621_07565 [Bryobacteraceae bacterium]|nr:hypothetical protein [Bryobacteraceae bacterium]